MDNLSAYCYGPVTVNSVAISNSTLEISVTGSNLRESTAVYSDCAYWQIGSEAEGERLLMVEKKTAAEILAMRAALCVEELSQITTNIERAIERWDSDGLNFYLHHSDNAYREYLVVAKRLTYKSV